MNIDKLSTEEFFTTVNEIYGYYKLRLPRDIAVALFISIEKDTENLSFRLDKQILRGQAKLDKLLSRLNPDLHKKLFHG